LNSGLEKSRSSLFNSISGIFSNKKEFDDELYEELEDVLLSSDIGVSASMAIIESLRERVKKERLKTEADVMECLHQETVALLSNAEKPWNFNLVPYVILMVGVNGVGKTTTTAKIANYFKSKGKKVVLAAGDTFRAAAVEQLQQWGERLDIQVINQGQDADPAAVAHDAFSAALARDADVLIIDTAGRLAVDEAMMTEISNIHKAIQPQETLFVVDSMTGQDAVNTAKAFNDILNFDGVILTKLDGDTRGGAAISIKSVVNKPIKFIGTGEKMEAIDVFYPSRMADRILGMGDVVSLVERAQEQYDEEEARKIQKKIAKNQFGFDDFLKQIQQIKKMGNMKDLIGMIPGAGKMMKDVDIDDDAFKGIEAIIHSMTPAERATPAIINASRKKRIGKGSGTSVQEVNQLLKQFNQMSKMMKMMQGGKGKAMMQAMKGMR